MPFLKKYIFLISLFTILLWDIGYSQEVPQSVTNTGIYEFLDELANIHIIEINSVVKPYSRLYISKKLQEADEKTDQLNKRQKKELEFYLKDFMKERGGEEEKGGKGDAETERRGDEETGKTGGVSWIKGGKGEGINGRTIQRRRDMLFYQDSLFQLTVNPIFGGEIFNNSSGKATYWRNGIEARGYIKHWGFYASLRDNHEKPLLGRPEYLTQRPGGHFKGTDWSEMQGGVTYSWKWGNAGLVKDGIQWGNNYNGANIFGGHNPTFVQLKLNISPVKWFTFSYFHGWLNSKVVDSTNSYWVTNSYGTDYREVYHKKFIAANMFTFTPFKNLNISAGNSIVYSDDAVNPSYLIPVLFYKSVDHSQTSGIDNMNSQMFFDVSSRQIKNLHLYVTMFIDELSVGRFTKDDEWNFFSWKTGFRLSDLQIDNLSLTTEFTYTYPLAFQHYVPTLTFENARYNMGHYLKDNSREWYFALDYRPMRTLDINLFFSDAVRGTDYTELGGSRLGNPPLATIEWHNTSYGLKASYQVINDLYTWGSFVNSDIGGDVRWSPEYYYGRKNTVNLGVTFGF
jgi:hypothetical protein